MTKQGLYYYDQAGNLIQTVPPEGVDRLSQAEVLAETPTNHHLKTQYKYNPILIIILVKKIVSLTMGLQANLTVNESLSELKALQKKQRNIKSEKRVLCLIPF